MRSRTIVDRRNLLRLGGAGAAVGAGSVLLRPGTAGAAVAGLQFGAQNDAGSDSTGLTSSNATGTLQISNSANAPALLVRSGAGVIGTGFTGGGVVGMTRGAGPGLWGQGDVGTGPAVKAEIDGTEATAHTIEAAQSGHGHGVFAHVDNATSTARLCSR